MAAVQPFDFHGTEVRVVTGPDGQPWVVAADVCAAIGIANHRDALGRLDGDEKGVGTTDTLGGPQQIAIVTEAGAYRLAMTSRRPESIAFVRWLSHDVVPAIARTGSYAVAPDLSTPAGVVAMAEQFLATAKALAASEERVAYLEPRAEVADQLLDATGDMSIADTAKALTRAGVETGERRLFQTLDSLGWIYRGRADNRWHVKQDVIESGRMAVIPQSHHHPRTGELVIDAPKPRVTPKGLEYLLRRLGPRALEVVS